MLRRPQHGFTLIELLVTVALAMAVLVIAMPSFEALFQRMRVASGGEALQAAVATARSEAVKSRTSVTVCPSNGSSSCLDTNDWHSGVALMTFIDSNGDGARQSAEIVVREQPLELRDVRIVGNGPRITFLATGRAQAARSVDVFIEGCTGTSDAGLKRRVEVALTGRASSRQLPCS